MANIYLILGGARSGKSCFAEREAIARANTLNKSLVYLATAQAHDDEMVERIRKHQQDRGEQWQTIECPIAVIDKLREFKQQQVVIVVDCLTLWLTNYLCDLGIEAWHLAKKQLNEALVDWEQAEADLFLVSNEVGHGIVPMGELSRQFVDESGWLHQDIAQVADNVDFIMAGLALNLKNAKGMQ